MKDKIYQSLIVIFSVTFFLWLAWWFGLRFFEIGPSADNFEDTYWIVPLSASAIGLLASKKWGGFKSEFGRTIAFFALGIGLQALGQIVYTLYFRFGEVELAFPSVGDIPYLLSNIFYIFAVISLLRVLCFGRNFYKPWWITGVALATISLIIFLMITLFLDIAVTDDRGTIYRVLNIAYPLVQSVYFMLGLIALLQSKILTGAKMFWAVTVMLVALLTQFLADFIFLYRSYHDTWEPAGISAITYLLAYGLMGLSIIMIDVVRRRALRSGQTKKG